MKDSRNKGGGGGDTFGKSRKNGLIAFNIISMTSQFRQNMDLVLSEVWLSCTLKRNGRFTLAQNLDNLMPEKKICD